ncbi:MAG TPA: PAS domain S-box protein [Candidatus Acidoferrum sp.]|nr:PAS domain S-box protein [Candidatus Acidoferrum sp.]
MNVRTFSRHPSAAFQDSLSVLVRSGSLPSLIASVGFLLLSLCVTNYAPRLILFLMPILLGALSFVVVLGTYSLWQLRREQEVTDRAFHDTHCEFSSIFQNVLDGILILDNDANCLDGNPAAASILRVPRNELIGKNIRSFLQNCDDFAQEWQTFLQRNGQRGRAELVAGDGTAVTVDFTASTNYVPGRHIFILCDVTERTRAENALRQSEERFQYMAENILEIIWTMNAQTKEVVYVNRAYANITGHTIEALYKNPSSYRELIHPQDRIRVLSKLQEVVASGSFDEEFQFIHASGAVRWIWVKAHPVKEKDRTRWLVGTAQDITSRKEAEKQIAEHLDATEAARAEAEALRKATLALSQNLAMDAVLDTLLQCIGELVPFDKGCVVFVEDASHLMVAREATRSEPNRAGLVLNGLENPFIQRILFEHKPVLLLDTAKEPDWKDSAPFDRTRSWMGIPLTAAGNVIGILSLSARGPGAFTAEHLRIARNLAVSAAVAIQNARVHERAEIYAAELEARLQELHEAQATLHYARTRSRPDGKYPGLLRQS